MILLVRAWLTAEPLHSKKTKLVKDSIFFITRSNPYSLSLFFGGFTSTECITGPFLKWFSPKTAIKPLCFLSYVPFCCYLADMLKVKKVFELLFSCLGYKIIMTGRSTSFWNCTFYLNHETWNMPTLFFLRRKGKGIFNYSMSFWLRPGGLTSLGVNIIHL